ncbi:MFS transporter [Cucumibacter marinus]|uniref:MFS transporter n=1 Tax=Cucumibacter marinus TaxID=1121252 RepID=UPI000421DD16|nr:MFS transporter [Cucumibacter marinus]
MVDANSDAAELTPETKRLAYRNIGLLAGAQALAGSSQAVVISVAALAAASLAPDPSLATVPVTAMVIGLALTAGPATGVIYTLGRTRGFMVGASAAILAGIVAAVGLIQASFVIFCLAMFMVGMSAAFGQQYRFAIADSVPGPLKSRAISLVLLGGVAAGFLGPRLSYITKDWLGAEFAGSFVALSMIAFVALVIIGFTRLAPVLKPEKGSDRGRPLKTLIKSPTVFIPIVTSVLAYALMNFVMVAAPLAMVYVCGHSTEAATTAIQWHIVAMFLPSLFTGFIIQRIGTHLTVAIGLALIIMSAAVNLNGITVTHFNISMVLLGLGWNFGFIGSTALLTKSYRPEEAGRVQAMNEMCVFGSMAIASITSGVLLNTLGWETINILVLPLATIGIALLAWDQFRRSDAMAAA